MAEAKGKPGPSGGPGAKSNAQGKPNVTGGDGITNDPERQPQTLAEIEDLAKRELVLAGPARPVDIFRALREQRFTVAETNLGNVDGILVRAPGRVAGVALFNTRANVPERRWAAAKLLYKLLGEYNGEIITGPDDREGATFAGLLLLPEADLREAYGKELDAGKTPDRAVKVIAGDFGVPLDYTAARVVGLGLTTKAKAKRKPQK